MVKFIIHKDLQNPSHPNYKKAVIVAWGLTAITLFLIPYDIYFWIKHPEDIAKNWTNIIGLVLFILNIALVRLLPNIHYSMAFLTISSLGPTMFSTYNTGGIFSSDIAWLLATIIGSYVFINTLCGTIVAVLVSMYLIALYYLDISSSHSFFKDYLFAHTSTHSLFTWMFVIVFISVLLVLFNRILENTNRKLEELTRQKIEDLEILVTKKTEEISLLRSEIAKDFHDEMGNKLASITVLSQSIGLKLKEIPLGDASEMLDTIQKRSTELYQGTKDFIWSINLKSDYVYELFLYLREFGEVFFNELDVDFQTSCNLNDTSGCRLAPNASRHLVYVAKEIFTNAAKHSKCSLVEFSLKFSETDKTLVMEITDNGIGFDSKKTQIRGLHNVQKRLEHINGSSSITSKFDQGTFFSIKVKTN